MQSKNNKNRPCAACGTALGSRQEKYCSLACYTNSGRGLKPSCTCGSCKRCKGRAYTKHALELSGKRTCVECGNPITPKLGKQKYCSADCAKRFKAKVKRPTRHTTACVECGKLVTSPGKRKYCSRECLNAYCRRNKTLGHPPSDRRTVICENCGVDFELAAHAAIGRRFCTVACRVEFGRNNPPDTKHGGKETCIACGKEYPCSPCQVGKRKFCCWECRVPYMKEHGMLQPNGNSTYECLECGFISRTNTYQALRRKYCSIECRDVALARAARAARKRVMVACLWCRKKFEQHPCKIGRDGSKNRGRFCSRNCNGSYTIRKQHRISKVEGRFFDMLEASGVEVHRQKTIGHFIVDAVVKTSNVVIEFDGKYWHSLPNVMEKDERKSDAIAWAGYKLVRVKEEDFYADPEGTVQAAIRQIRTL